MVVAKESDVNERMTHTGGEQKKRKWYTKLQRPGAENWRKRGCWASCTTQALFALTRTHYKPRKSGKCGSIAACLLRTALICPIRAPRNCAALDC